MQLIQQTQYGWQPVMNDTGSLSLTLDTKKAAWNEHYTR